MQITSSATFAASAAQVQSMLTDEGYLSEVCRAGGATDFSVGVEASGATTITTTSRTLPAPKEAARFTGPQLVVVERIVWTAPDPDGGRVGELTLTIEGQPVKMTGQATVNPGTDKTTVDVTGDLKVNIPLLGGRLEKAAAPAILAGIDVQQDVGNRWLA